MSDLLLLDHNAMSPQELNQLLRKLAFRIKQQHGDIVALGRKYAAVNKALQDKVAMAARPLSYQTKLFVYVRRGDIEMRSGQAYIGFCRPSITFHAWPYTVRIALSYDDSGMADIDGNAVKINLY